MFVPRIIITWTAVCVSARPTFLRYARGVFLFPPKTKLHFFFGSTVGLGPLIQKLLSRDLRRVRDDAFVQEQRLDQALEEERADQEAFRETRQLQQEAQRIADEQGGGPARAADEQDSSPADAVWEEEVTRGDDVVVASPADEAADAAGQAVEPWGEEKAEGYFEDRGMGFSGYGVALDGEGDVDFVGEDEEDNVWQ